MRTSNHNVYSLLFHQTSQSLTSASQVPGGSVRRFKEEERNDGVQLVGFLCCSNQLSALFICKM